MAIPTLMLGVQILLQMNQINLARDALNLLSAYEDHNLVKLATCWVLVAEGDKNKCKEAVYKYEELIEKFSKYNSKCVMETVIDVLLLFI